MFYQLYTVQIQGPGIAPACVYGFLPNKTESNPKVSVFAGNSRYGVFEEKKVPRTGGEGEKRN